jgi:ferredoxin
VKVVVDGAKCMGHARCNAVAPDAFDLDDEGYAIVTDNAAKVPETDLHSAVASCPEQAIRIEP